MPHRAQGQRQVIYGISIYSYTALTVLCSLGKSFMARLLARILGYAPLETLFVYQVTIHCMHYTLCTIHYTPHTAHATHCTPHTAHHTLHTPHTVLPYTLHTMHYTPHTAHH
jgi:hypothetical protein